MNYNEIRLPISEASRMHCGGKPNTPWADLWKAQDTCPKTIYYLDAILAGTDEKEVKVDFKSLCAEVPQKRTRKPKAAKLTVCPHCGMSLESKTNKLSLVA
jgi:hypothetical protein